MILTTCKDVLYVVMFVCMWWCLTAFPFVCVRVFCVCVFKFVLNAIIIIWKPQDKFSYNNGQTHNNGQRQQTTEVGIYKRKQEIKKTRTRPGKRSRKQENKNSTKKATKKKRKTFFFSWSLSWSISCFLSFLLSFINSHLSLTKTKTGPLENKYIT